MEPPIAAEEDPRVGALTLLDIEKIRQLVEMMVANDLVEMSLRDGEVEVTLCRPNASAGDTCPVVSAQPQPVVPVAAPPAVVEQPAEEAPVAAEETELLTIRSPMVGTFYAAPDPDSPPFVEIGGQVIPSTVVCILEAMKVFSEIKAEVSGTMERVLVANAQAVEYGQPLFLVRPD